MLITLISWIFYTFYCFIFGLIIWQKFPQIIKNEKNISTLIKIILLGLASLIAVLQISHLFIRINWEFMIIFNLIIISLLFYKKNVIINLIKSLIPNHKKINKTIFLIQIFFLIIGTFFLSFKTAGRIENYDSYLYHAQAIRWIEEFSIVPGLGNLYSRLAFNSSWHLLSAFFGASYLFSEPLSTLNGWLIWIFFSYCVIGLNIFSDKNKVSTTINIIKFILLTILIRDPNIYYNISSPETDTPIIIFTLFIILFSIESKIFSKRKTKFNYLIFILISAAITIKLSAIPLLLYPLVSIYTQKKSRQNLSKILIIPIIFFIPFVVRNIFLSGYLIYPFPYINIINADWKIPYQNVIEEANWIKSWGIEPGVNPETILSLSFFERFLIWYKNQDIKNIKLFLNILLLTSSYIIAYLFSLIKDYKFLKLLFSEIKRNMVIILTTIAGIIFWFTQSPDFRFGYGFIIGLIILLIIPFIKVLLKILFSLSIVRQKLMKKIISIFVYLTILYLSYACWFQNGDCQSFISFSRYLFKPAGYTQVKTKTILIQNTIFFIPDSISSVDDDLVGYHSFPSSPYISENLALRKNNNIKYGFLMHSIYTKK